MRKENAGPRMETRTAEFSWAVELMAEYELMRQRIFGGIR
jgi:hypothetical protein